MDFTQINNQLGDLFGVTLFDPQQFISLVIRFFINLVVVVAISRYFYYPHSRRRDYMFIFILMSMSIFLLVSLMEGGGMELGAAMGLFAIFGIMRFRTEAVPIREMTYLFMLIAVSVINAVAQGDYHPKALYWDGVGIVTIVFVNLVFVFMAWLFESTKILSDSCSKYIKYDNVALVAPDKREELKADLEKRTGLKIQRIEVGMIDYLKDAVLIRIFYDDVNDRGSSVAGIMRMPR
jgi:hypothetical protein